MKPAKSIDPNTRLLSKHIETEVTTRSEQRNYGKINTVYMSSWNRWRAQAAAPFIAQ